ncbi:helix-turn-helix transcriptional regulator [Pseudoalteromonas sp. JBTF-M23]|uniref:Helix-turn-helix transcriptional regulator n=1 Tax=Pseudoalteromonas caenipelagi TaxID=2726988 RepID=A0A849VA51_9GAMM|nr:helix-turn-helix transcriptional regulator [Pseudoalteromonas caenipelagi]NOU49805.1 helix-turn-helix transcriptional regulator [Pseudoalteromonas caenipelagi]
MSVAIFPTIVFSAKLGVAGLAIAQSSFGYGSLQKYRSFLTAVLVLFSIHALGDLVLVSGGYRYVPNLVGLQLPLTTFIGPAFYFYTRSLLLRANKNSIKSIILACVGPALVMLSFMPFALLVSAEQKLALANPATRDPALYQFALLTCLSTTLVFLGTTLTYFRAAYMLQVKHRAQLMQRFSDIQRQSLDWLRIILILWGAVWSLYSIEYFLGFIGVKWIGSGVMIPILELVLLVAFAHLSLNQPRLDEQHKTQEPEPATPRIAILDPQRMTRIADKLRHAMEQEHLFKDNELSLSRLSSAINVSENHISETLSQHLHCNFFQLINEYRVEEAKRLLASTDHSIVDVSFESGFNSRSTFNTAFKNAVGLTPSAYRQANLEINTKSA